MLKYTVAEVGFREIPDEISLNIQISNCPIKCKDCHSKHLWKDIGERLSAGKLCDLVTENPGISCICFMGGESNLEELFTLFKFCRLLFKNLKVAWYTGLVRSEIPEGMPLIDYIKTGPYKKKYGPLNNPDTNQRFYVLGRNLNENVKKDEYYDKTYLFWKHPDLY